MAYHFYDKMFGDYIFASAVSDNSSGVNAYASRFGSGEFGISVVNPTNQNVAIKLNVENLRKYDFTNLYWYEIRGSFDYRDTKFYINEETAATSVGGGSYDYDEILAYGSDFSIGDTIIIPPFSTNFIVLKGNHTTDVNDHLAENIDISLFPNPIHSLIYIKSEVEILSYEIYSLNGESVSCDRYSKPIDISTLSSGVYLIKLKTDRGNRCLNFVKN